MSASSHNILPSYDLGNLHVHPGPSFIGIGVELILVVTMILVVRYAKKSTLGVLIYGLYEEIFLFFEDILGVAEKYWVKSFVTTMFFIILISNILGVVFEIFGPMFGIDEVGHPTASAFFGIPTSDLNFNIALATLSVLLMLILQWKHGAHLTFGQPREKLSTIGAGLIYILIILGVVLGVMTTISPLIIVIGIVVLSLIVDAVSLYMQQSGVWKSSALKSSRWMGIIHALHEYLPVTGKNILTVDKGNKSRGVFIPMWILVKAFDVLISLFLGMLEIIGLFAKILSLSFRLYGNMISGGILLGILLAAMAGGFNEMLGINITAIAPVLVYLQELLVALIQALVFPLLVAIFFKVAQADSEG